MRVSFSIKCVINNKRAEAQAAISGPFRISVQQSRRQRYFGLQERLNGAILVTKMTWNRANIDFGQNEGRHKWRSLSYPVGRVATSKHCQSHGKLPRS
jgi:hypothetical protein